MKALRRSRLAHGAEALVAQSSQGDDAASSAEPALDCDLLIVGSGYGGAVAVARFAGAGVADPAAAGGRRAARVWLLERGREHVAGRFPSRFADLPGAIRFGRQDGRPPRGVADGLFDLRIGADVNVLVGNGLGGGSLINAGVMEQPPDTVFDARWPAALVADATGRSAGFERAKAMLGAAPLPDPAPAKLVALQAMAAAHGQTSAGGFKCHVAVSVDADPSPAGVEMRACTRCGDCVTGCNQGAKHTLDTNYLAWARRAGARLYTGAAVERVESLPGGRGWRVRWHYTEPGKRTPGAASETVRAGCVILAAGSLGSTEILLRSAAAGLPLASPRLGERFSTNGNQIAAAYRQQLRVHASRDENVDPARVDNDVGPTITGLVPTVRDGRAFVVEEFAVPAPLRRVMGEVTTTLGTFQGLFREPLPRHAADGDPDGDPARLEDELAVTTSSLEHTSIVGFLGDDGAAGRIALAPSADQSIEAGVVVRWNRADTTLAGLVDAQMDWLKHACADGAIGGIELPNPTWQLLPSDIERLLGGARATATTVHPLGGCAMADDAAHGVVDHAGRVFDGAGGVHRGLAVLDGATFPGALGLNPALTIAALAERAVPLLAADAGWGFSLADQSAPPAGPLPPADDVVSRWQRVEGATALRIGERLHGPLTIGGRACWAELDVPAIPIADLARTLTFERRPLAFPSDRPPVLTLYPERPFSDADRKRLRVGRARLTGAMDLLEPGRLHRLAADKARMDAIRVVLDRVLSRPRGSAEGQGPFDALPAGFQFLLDAVTKTRTLRYRFAVATPGSTGLAAGDSLVGTKTLGFSEQGNPWRQLSTMVLERTASDGAPSERLGELEADLDYFVQWRLALLDLTRQRDQPNALADLASFALLTARALMTIHWPTFLPPGDTPQRIAERRPAPLDGLSFAASALTGAKGAFVTRYRPIDGDVAAGTRPLLLIHGLSASGSTFAHPSIPVNLVRYMAGRQRRDVWVLDLRTSAANEPRPGEPRQSALAFDAAAGDIPIAVAHVCRETGSDQVDVVAHCIGSVMFALAVLSDDVLHQHVGRVALSQVGPIARLSPYNRLRGVIASFLAQYLEVDELDVRADHEQVAPGQWQPNAARSRALTLLDALLASFPYPADECEAARARLIDCVPGTSRDFRIVRHRADALIGHTLRLENVGAATLLALDAIYGWVKSATLAQVMHIAREGVPPATDGTNRVVSGAAIGRRFGFPVLLLHGRHNQIFDARGSEQCHGVLRRTFGDASADLPAIGGDRHLGVGTRRQLVVLDRYGHQDTMIGERAHVDVFPYIENFLAAELPEAAPLPTRSLRFECTEPWMGPTLGLVRVLDASTLRLSVLVHAGPRRADLLGIVTIPARRDADGRHWIVDPGADPSAVRVHAVPLQTPQQTPRDALLEQALQLDLRRPAAGETPACAVLLLYRRIDDPSTAPDHLPRPPRRGQPPTPGGDALSAAALAEVVAFVAERNARQKDDLVLSVPPAVVAAADGAPRLPDASFVLGSCQYPFGLWDRLLAGGSWYRLNAELRRADGFDLRLLLADAQAGDADTGSEAEADAYVLSERTVEAGVIANLLAGATDALPPLPAPGFALLLGDQVYVDAASNVFEAPTLDVGAPARRAYELNWRLRAWRRVSSRLPMLAMLDDHEVSDNWQPRGRNSDATEKALDAYRQHQAKLGPPTGDAARETFSFAFAPGGLPIFVLDTRSRREPRSVDGAAGSARIDVARIVPDSVMRRLERWLIVQRDAPVKFVASPSTLLPPERHDGDHAERLGLDSWSGYPASMARLLRFIDDEAIDGVVLLSGNAHFSCVTRFTYASGRRLHAIVASGLYAPWPFSNQHPDELVRDGDWRLEVAGTVVEGRFGGVAGHMTDSGYAVVAAGADAAGAPQLRVDLCPADGSAAQRVVFDV